MTLMLTTIVVPNLCFLSLRTQILATCLFLNFAELCKVSARLDNIDIRHFIRVPPLMFFDFLIYQKCCPILLKLCTAQQNQKISKQPKFEVSNSKNKDLVQLYAFQKVQKLLFQGRYPDNILVAILVKMMTPKTHFEII